MAVSLPPELFCQIALHLSSTKDVLTFSLIHSRVRKALSTPALFKERLELQGWDLTAWLDEDSHAAAAAQSPPGNLERWMRIDHTYCRIVQLFDEAAADSEIPPDVDLNPDAPLIVQPDPNPFGDIITPQYPDQSQVTRNPLLDKKAIVWLRKLSEVLPVFLTHHRGVNILRIMEARYRGALVNYARVLSSICVDVTPGLLSRSQAFKPKLAITEYAWLERMCFCLVALLIQCEANTVTSIFDDNVVYGEFPLIALRSFWTTDVHDHDYPVDSDLYVLLTAMTKARQIRISECYLSTFMIQAGISMSLHSGASQPLRAPSLPFINPAASFFYDKPFELQQGTTPSPPLPPPRPWLRNRLAGTPLVELSSPDRRLWAGYFTYEGESVGLDPPMFLELYSVEGPPAYLRPDSSECTHFYGEGHDGVGTFSLRGTCDSLTGLVSATKAYTTHEWKWQGMMTPFGMAGVWSGGFITGCWWIWPREWSSNPATT